MLFILCLKTEWHSTDVTSSGNGRFCLIASYFLFPTGQILKFKMSTFIQTGLMQEINKKVTQFCLLAKRQKNVHVRYILNL